MDEGALTLGPADACCACLLSPVSHWSDFHKPDRGLSMALYRKTLFYLLERQSDEAYFYTEV